MKLQDWMLLGLVVYLLSNTNRSGTKRPDVGAGGSPWEIGKRLFERIITKGQTAPEGSLDGFVKGQSPAGSW